MNGIDVFQVIRYYNTSFAIGVLAMSLDDLLAQISEFFAANPELKSQPNSLPWFSGTVPIARGRQFSAPMPLAPPRGSQIASLSPVGKVRQPQRGVFAINGGVVEQAGWQNAKNHRAGAGYRIYVREPDGFSYMYGHMDPTTAPKPGTQVSAGDYIGSYANPTNGHSSGPHVHVQRWTPGRQAIVDPGSTSPLKDKATRGAGFQNKDPWHPNGHQGVDWSYPK